MNELPALPDFEQTVRRFEAWWQRELLDRPPVTLAVQPSRPYRGPVSQHASLRERWLDVEFNVAAAIAELERRDYVGDSFPLYCPNIGPELTATLYGCELDFGEHTSWSHPVVETVADWEHILQLQPDFTNPYWQAVEQMTALAIRECAGRYVVGLYDLHGNLDILAGLRDPQMLCLDLADCPELVQRATQHVAAGFVAAFQRNHAQVAAAGFGSTCWTPMYHRGPAYVPSCDFWCMISPAMAHELVMPVLQMEAAPLERSIFHLDGVQALKHLDLLLEWPQLDAVQWVYGAGAGPAVRWVDVYRRIQAAGKSVQVIAADAADALTVLRQLNPAGVWLTIEQPFASVAEAESFLEQVARSGH